MSSSDDYIIIEKGKNTSDDATDTDANVHDEADEASLKALEKQGIFLAGEKDLPIKNESPDDFSKELRDLSGIEILSSDDEDSFI